MKKVRKARSSVRKDSSSANDHQPTRSSDSANGLSSVPERGYDLLLRNAPQLIMIVAVISLLAILALRLHLIFVYAPELGGVESNVIYSLQRLLAGYSLYIDPAVPPYSITQYAPLYYYVCAAIGTLFQVDPDQVRQVYILSRSVSLGLNLLFSFTAFLVLHWVFQVRQSLSFLALAYALIYLDEESFSRPDSLYNLMFLLTVGLFLRWLTRAPWRDNPAYLVGISVCSVATIFAKQSGIYLPVLMILFLVGYLRNVRWTAIATLTMVGTFGILILVSANGDIHAFWQNTVQGVNNGASLTWFAKRIMVEHFQKERFINVLGLFVGVYYLAKGNNHALKFLGLAILGSFTFALVTSTKIGAAPNYFTEFIALTVIAVIVFAAQHDPWVGALSHRGGPAGLSRYRPLLYLIFIVFTLLPRFGGKFQKKYLEINDVGRSGYLESQAVAHYLYAEERLQPDEQVLITTHVHDYLNKFLYRNAVFPQKEIVVANPPGIYDYRAFHWGVHNGTLDYVIASVSEGHVDTVAQEVRIKFSFLGTDFSPYVPIRRIGDYVVFEHQSRTN